MKALSVKAAMILALLLAGAIGTQAASFGAPAAVSSAQKAADPPKAVNAYGATPEQQKRHLELFRLGAKLWPIYCNHCHNAPNPEEEAPYQWDQIMMHMRTLENLPPQDEDATLEYLKTAR
jgi:hypothetical protein